MSLRRIKNESEMHQMKTMIKRYLNQIDDSKPENDRTLKIIFAILRKRLILNESPDDRLFYRSQVDDVLDNADERQMRLILTFAKSLLGN